MRRVIVLLSIVGTAALVMALGSGAAAARSASCPDSNLPNEIVLAAGSGQTAQLGQPFQTAFQVRLANRNGCPVTGNLAGINVTFDGPDAGPSGVFAGSGWREATVGTDSNGVATAPAFTANFTTGAYTVFAHSAYGDVQFSVINTANGLPASISAIGGSGQTTAVSSQYAQPLKAKVVDANGQPVQGARVDFSVVAGSTGAAASFLAGAETTATTNSAGVATSPPLVANGTAGRFTAIASVNGVPAVAVFALDNHAGARELLARRVVSTATAGAAFRSPLEVRLVDGSGDPIEGQTITFSLAAQDASPAAGALFRDGSTSATSETNAGGVATSPPFIANHTAGTFVATATGGLATVDFRLRIEAGPAATIAVGAASGETTPISTRFVVPLAVSLSDRFGNRVAGAALVFSAPRRGASGRFVVAGKKRRSIKVTTNARGVAVAPPFIANKTVGGYLVRVSVKGSRARGSFALVNTPRA